MRMTSERPLWLFTETGRSYRTTFLCLVFVSASYLTQRRGENQTELFIRRSLHTGKNVFQKLQVQRFNSEVRDNVLYQYVSGTYITISVNVRQRLVASRENITWAQSNTIMQTPTHANRKPHRYKTLCLTHNIPCPKGCRLHCNSPAEAGGL